MEVIRTTIALVMVMGWFWDEVLYMLKNTTKKYSRDNMELNKSSNVSSRTASKSITTTTTTTTKDDDDVTAAADDDDDSTSCLSVCDIGDDMMMNILSRIPPTTLMKFKSVSKSWTRVILETCRFLIPRDGYFMSGIIISKKGYLAYPPKCEVFYCHPPLHGRITTKNIFRHRMFYRFGYEDSNQTVAKSFIEPLPPPSHYHESRILLDCCNGLLLFRVSNDNTTPPRYIVCNPTTGECVTIPGETIDADSTIFTGNLAFDPSESLHYKLVVVLDQGKKGRYLTVFSSETRRWTELEFHLEPLILLGRWFRSVYLGGILYKLSSTGHLLRIFINIRVSKMDQIQSIHLPLARHARLWFSEYIGQTNGRLLYGMINGVNLLIFTLKHTNDGDYNDSLDENDLYWSLDHTISGIHAEPEIRSNFLRSCIYGFHPHTELVFLGNKRYGKRIKSFHSIDIYTYNYKKKKFEGYTVLDYTKIRSMDFFVFPFTRCFLPMGGEY